MLDRPDSSGLVCGYRIGAAGRLDSVQWADMDAALADPDSITWLHFNLADVRARAWIADAKMIPAAAKAILLGQSRHLKLEVFGEALAGVVCDLHHEFAERSEELDVLRIFLDRRCLISARRAPLAGIDKLRRSLDEGLQINCPAGIVTHFLHHVTDTLGDLLVKLSDDLDDLEEVILEGRRTVQSPQLAGVRRVAVRLRRHLVPQQHALVGLVSRMPSWIREDDAHVLRAAIERLGAFGHDLDLVQDRARLLADQLAARLAESTNRNLYTLSIVTTIFLPMTLVTGIFGMNLGGLPWQGHAQGFWIGIAIMVGLGAVTLWMLRRREMM